MAVVSRIINKYTRQTQSVTDTLAHSRTAETDTSLRYIAIVRSSTKKTRPSSASSSLALNKRSHSASIDRFVKAHTHTQSRARLHAVSRPCSHTRYQTCSLSVLSRLHGQFQSGSRLAWLVLFGFVSRRLARSRVRAHAIGSVEHSVALKCDHVWYAKSAAWHLIF